MPNWYAISLRQDPMLNEDLNLRPEPCSHSRGKHSASLITITRDGQLHLQELPTTHLVTCSSYAIVTQPAAAQANIYRCFGPVCPVDQS